MRPNYLIPINGLIIGAFRILFRKWVSKWLQNAYEKFPKYEDGIKASDLSFSVEPVFVLILGALCRNYKA